MPFRLRLFHGLIVVGSAWIVFVASAERHRPSMEHGGIQMGVPLDGCDNGKWKLDVDWDDSTDYDYQCQSGESPIPPTRTTPVLSCLRNEEIPMPLHKCMTEAIEYDDQPPRGGPHRPLWPVYGEYLYLPPQRWVHSLEHGAVVFLYHPCADRKQINHLRSIARLCLRRHIITPYRKLPRDQPYAVLSYGCRLTMGSVNYIVVTQFVKENARNPQRASEADMWKDGQYSHGLLVKASVVSDVQDSNLCPQATYSI